MENMRRKAQSLIEYGLILALVAVIAVVILGKFGKTLTDVGNRTNSDVNAASQNATANYCTSIGLTLQNGTCQ
mgnify:CR=1 FL=1